MANPLLVNVAELTRRAGSEKLIDVAVDVAHFDFDDQRVVATEVPIRLQLESVNGGIAVRGELSLEWSDQCSRCLKPVHGVVTATVNELYQQLVTDPDAYEIVGEQLDLSPMVREVLLLELPTLPICAPECPGLCTVCGADLAVSPCNCAPIEKSSPWDALDALKGRLSND